MRLGGETQATKALGLIKPLLKAYRNSRRPILSKSLEWAVANPPCLTPRK
jgi:hypothetical protein